jgi:hypothetical protein
LFATGLQKRMGVEEGYILLNTSFGAGNHVLGLEHFLKKAQFNYQALYDESFFMAMHKYQNKLVKYFIGASVRLAKSFPECQVILRPHPSEDMGSYQSSTKGIDNLLVTREGIAAEWITGARVLVHHDCTTGLEALFHEVPTISYCPIFEKEIVKSGSVKASHMVYDEDTLLETVDDVLQGRRHLELTPNRRKYLRQSVDNVEYDSGERIVSTVEERLEELLERSRAGGKICSTVCQPPPNPDQDVDEETKRRYEQYRRNKLEGLEAEEVEAFVSRFVTLDESLRGAKITELGNEGFLMVPK